MNRSNDTLRLLAPGLLLAAAACAQPAGPAATPEVATSTQGVLQRVSNFGSNPGGLNMFKYVPANLPAGAPLVVAMHACTQSASAYENAGWNDLADQHGFAVLYPEQTSINNPAGCFNWGGEGYVGPRDTSNLQRGQGEGQSILQMIDRMATDDGIDVNQVFMMGHSGGAAQVALMVALYPDRFQGGGIIAGIPFYCTTELLEVSGCLNPGVNRTPQQWGDLARMGFPGYSGAWPRLTIWHGSGDTTVAIRNQTEILEQFTNLYGIDGTADSSSTIGSATVENYDGANGTLIQTVTLPGFGHGTPVVPGSGCGRTGSFFLTSDVCAVEEMAKFWGLIGGVNPGDTTAPTVDITAPANGATVMGNVTVTIQAQDDTAVARVELFANGNLATTLTAAPYTYTWDVSGLAAGQYSLRAVAYDAAGNTAADDDTTVTVQSAVMDTQAPTVQITAPADQAMVTGQVALQATATDDFGVSVVEFLVDGVSVGQASAAPYTVTWDASTVADGAHVIAAQARDAAGNQGEAMVTVTVTGGAPADTTPPTITITSPEDGATVSGVIRINAEGMDDTRVAATVLLIDGERKGTGIFPPYSFIWDTNLVETGTHAVTVSGIDPAGNAGAATIIVEVERAPTVTPDPMTNPNPNGNGNDNGVDNSRWGCSASPDAGEGLFLAALIGLGGLLSRRRR